MARLFNGTNESLISNTTPVLSEPFALTCCANSADSTQDNQVPIGLGAAASDDYYAINFNTTASSPDGVRAIEYDGSAKLAQTAVDWSQDTWHNSVALFVSATDRRIFLDGANKATNTTSSNPDDMTLITIGARDAAGIDAFFDGHVAECAIWDLSAWPGATAADKANNFEKIIPSLGKTYSPLFYPLGLVAYWRLRRDLKDEVGGYNMTATGTTVSAHPRVIYPSKIWVPSGAVVAPPVGNPMLLEGQLMNSPLLSGRLIA